ncbi:RNA polymerase subunit sigma-54 [Marinobacterium nitratireducens]|uniref:HTH-type transcriptional regulatory protein TyrR n=1 Tax=Marinobacterium nitratireducens TaxID=518897 RepID=A0A918DNX4_9GAMM|nr:sigma 54-interacting transcriptional regulator [Marinobacterium nitratireducens]GGO75507.1 RNA polymerase subunit sigma-54 [Marinobacterium nitratireducens]
MTQSYTERELEMVLEKSRDNIMITDGEGVILRAGSNCARIYGREISQLLGVSAQQLEREGLLRPSVTVQVLKRREPVQVMQSTDTGRTVMAEGFPVFDENGTLIRVVSFSQDLTDLHLLQKEYELLQQKLAKRRYPGDAETVRVDALGFRSPQVRELYELLQRIAPTDASLLLLGESGVGKTAFAQLTHRLSPRRDGPFIEVNCSAIPENLFESEMFGYAPGSFTGAARQGKPGLIEQAQGGTLFLDEVGDLPLPMQVKLLKVLQDGKVTRLGSTEPRAIDFRLISATNHALDEQVAAGSFRLDLFYRLNVVPMTIPALRERPEDIPVLLEIVLARLNERYGQSKVLDSQALHQLVQYDWPGNVRELENVLERFYVASPDQLIRCEMGSATPAAVAAPVEVAPQALQGRSLTEALDAYERKLLEEALGGCRSTYELAERLGLSQPTVFRRLRKHGLSIGGA